MDLFIYFALRNFISFTYKISPFDVEKLGNTKKNKDCMNMPLLN